MPWETARWSWSGVRRTGRRGTTTASGPRSTSRSSPWCPWTPGCWRWLHCQSFLPKSTPRRYSFCKAKSKTSFQFLTLSNIKMANYFCSVFLFKWLEKSEIPWVRRMLFIGILLYPELTWSECHQNVCRLFLEWRHTQQEKEVLIFQNCQIAFLKCPLIVSMRYCWLLRFGQSCFYESDETKISISEEIPQEGKWNFEILLALSSWWPNCIFEKL